MVITAGFINSLVGGFLWPLGRILAVISTMPVFGTKNVPARIKIVLSVLLCFAIFPTLSVSADVNVFSFEGALLMAEQVLIGVSIGFTLQVVFQTFVLSGQIVAMQSGLGFASMVDPQSGHSMTMVSEYYLLFVSLCFLALNGHLMVINFIIESFKILPVDQELMSLSGFWHLAMAGKWMFANAVLVALPAIISLLLVNFSFGVMTKASPQLNMFSLGFPITLILGLIILYFRFQGLLPHFVANTDLGFEYLHKLLGGLAHG